MNRTMRYLLSLLTAVLLLVAAAPARAANTSVGGASFTTSTGAVLGATYYSASPTGGDDAAPFVALAQAQAYKSCVVLKPGNTYHWNTVNPITKSGVCIRTAAPGVKILSALTERGGPASPYNDLFGVDTQTAPLDGAGVLAKALAPGRKWAVITGALNGDGHALAYGDAIGIRDTQTSSAAQQQASYVVSGGYQLGTVALVSSFSSFNGQTLILTVRGVTTTVTFSSTTNLASILSQVNTAVSTALSASVTVASNDNNAFLVLSDATAPILVSSSSTALTGLGITAGTSVALDRATLYQGASGAGFPASSSVIKFIQVSDLDIDLAGAEVVTGSTWERIVSCAGCRRLRIRNIRVTGAGNEYTISSDEMSFDTIVENISCVEGGTSCVAIEGTEQATVRNVSCTNSPITAGFNPCVFVQSARNVLIEGVESNGRIGTSGSCITIGDTSDVIGSEDITILRARCMANYYGLVVTGGSRRVTCRDCTIEQNVSYGVLVQQQSTPTRIPGDVTLDGGWLSRNGLLNGVVQSGASGIYVDGAPRVKLRGTRCYENAGGCAQVINGGELAIVGADIQEGMGPNLAGISTIWGVKSNSSTDKLTVDASTISSSYTNTHYGVWSFGTTRVTNTRFALTSGNAMGILVQGGTTTFGGIEFLTTIDYGVYQTAGSLFRLDGGSSIATHATVPWTTTSANFGSLTSNGTTGVTITGSFQASATLTFGVTTIGATPCLGWPYVTAQSAGSATTKNVTGSCNTVFAWQAN